ncbi:NAD(+) diphosphatase [Sphingosinicella rhizophila]|uniref:NAD(+) diphosphatase n=1 Tax=Sphingosinicella rhizophila TaxID=3050082 RepID=A0ABU3Q778_9SPHN|nr:NAD(+) diphosphatase [Sphingosinicella sp. GR2756]MDT9599162.1 NAD(+) diphosphatase [Sphingosinicella sp. GR2756]
MAAGRMSPIRPGFTGAGLDRADRLRLDEARLDALAASASARLLRLAALDPVLDGDGRLCWDPMTERVAETGLIFLGLDGERPLFAPIASADPGQRAWSVFHILAAMAPADAALWGGARSLIGWHNRHLFCGRCGTGTDAFRAGWGRRCGGCGLEHFPRIDPVVIMLAEHGGRVLLGRQPGYPPRRFSALAGFVEPGESIEEAVARELGEEAGLEVGDVRYVASQPWPFPGQLMIACFARARDDRLTIDRDELEAAMWVDRADVLAALAGDPEAPFLAPPPFAIAHSLLVHWAQAAEPLAAGATRL